MCSERGLTLIELMVVFAIAALLIALVPTAYGKLRESVQYRDALRAVMRDLRQARLRATSQGIEARFNVDLAKGLYGVDGSKPRVLPAPLKFRVTVASIELAPQDIASIRFLPEGGATGGSVDILRPAGNGARLQIDWLSGATRLLGLPR